MSMKPVTSWALLLLVLGTVPARAQDYLRARESPDVPSATQAPLLPEMPPPVALPSVTGPDNYMTYQQPCCCGPVGGDGPIGWELFIMTGPQLPVAGSFLNHYMNTGWMVRGGGRSLFFNVDRDAAWTVELGISQSVNQGKANMWLQQQPQQLINPNTGAQIPGLVPGPIETVDVFMQTLVNLGFGREWYLLGAAYVPGNKWRVGADGGGLWGAANITYHDFQPTNSQVSPTNLNLGEFDRRSHVSGGCYAGLHTDFEIPCNCCTFIFGLRAEWMFTTTRVLNSADNGIQWVNFMANFGVRF